MRVPECHPERPYQARGMCGPCYFKQQNAKRPSRRKDPSEYAPNYRKPVHQPARVNECGHPEREHVAFGLCAECYRNRDNRNMADCHPDQPLVARGLCSACHSKRRYELNPEQARRLSRESQARSRKRNRDELIAAYGGKCACEKCPETNQAFLTLEHIGGGGRQHRKEMGSHTYADLRRRGFPQEGYTLLCWNCNAGSRFTGVCPHMD